MRSYMQIRMLRTIYKLDKISNSYRRCRGFSTSPVLPDYPNNEVQGHSLAKLSPTQTDDSKSNATSKKKKKSITSLRSLSSVKPQSR